MHTMDDAEYGPVPNMTDIEYGPDLCHYITAYYTNLSDLNCIVHQLHGTASH